MPHFTEETTRPKEAKVSEPDEADPGLCRPCWWHLPAQLFSLVLAGLPGTGPGEGTGLLLVVVVWQWWQQQLGLEAKGIWEPQVRLGPFRQVDRWTVYRDGLPLWASPLLPWAWSRYGVAGVVHTESLVWV